MAGLCWWKSWEQGGPQELLPLQAWPRAGDQGVRSAWDAAAECWRLTEIGCCRGSQGCQHEDNQLTCRCLKHVTIRTLTILSPGLQVTSQ